MALEIPTTDAEPGLDVLALNSGSSSLKFALFHVSSKNSVIQVSGEASRFGDKNSRFLAQNALGNIIVDEMRPMQNHSNAIARIGNVLADAPVPWPAAVGHRVVHGGPKLRQHCVLDEFVRAQLQAASSFAPLHLPTALEVVASAKELFPGVPHVACFDTTFHTGLPDIARVLPIPRELQAEGIQRYGFHGLSCESILRQLAQPVPNRLVIAHLGNGASITAIKGGKSIDTSMGLTPTGGVVMGTRSGDLDPGVLFYLMREKAFGAGELEDLLNHRSGLLGLSGVSSDMRTLRETALSNADARLAIDIFCTSVRKQIAAMSAVLNGIDMLVFTGGIGEHDAQARASICAGLSWMGVNLDAARNRSLINPISNTDSRSLVVVLGAKEEEQIARHCWALLAPIDASNVREDIHRSAP